MTTEENSLTGIPITTIARLFKEVAFKDVNGDTRITLSTLKLSSEYIRLFINEAIIRANEERILEGDSLSKVDGIDNVVSNNNQTNAGDVDGGGDEIEEDDAVVDDDEIEDIDPDDLQDSNTQRQLKPDVPTANDTLDSRHLSKVAGLLILDF
ncbi:uncharacterized protein RJT20DRAFT_62509 [Scheffersomyces xylosifermentans]|uniref:uncharacterized protein n=1 Tax=Scheffersomyces xylosifermentans TaxID=1304137 RepID=UPI00315D428D